MIYVVGRTTLHLPFKNANKNMESSRYYGRARGDISGSNNTLDHHPGPANPQLHLNPMVSLPRSQLNAMRDSQCSYGRQFIISASLLKFLTSFTPVHERKQ
ncbi:unnamed protein product [Rhizoctonia solani]|uniref:Uncharacterized protein n=1 Tax=Rhizoctonia solani TaxID=456999 RepID=A0A8H3AC94_9AGAM|nr:unnamed protein product [Rhizoctonia solani]